MQGVIDKNAFSRHVGICVYCVFKPHVHKGSRAIQTSYEVDHSSANMLLGSGLFEHSQLSAPTVTAGSKVWGDQGSTIIRCSLTSVPCVRKTPTEPNRRALRAPCSVDVSTVKQIHTYIYICIGFWSPQAREIPGLQEAGRRPGKSLAYRQGQRPHRRINIKYDPKRPVRIV